MKRKLFLSLAAVLMAASAIKAQIPSDEQLRRYAAQMLMVFIICKMEWVVLTLLL